MVDVLKMKVWSCGEEHRPIMFDGDIICECGMKAITYQQAQEIGLPKLWDRINILRNELSKFKPMGTDGCSKCEIGRVTMFTKTSLCIDCEIE